MGRIDPTALSVAFSSEWRPPKAVRRCSFIKEQVVEKAESMSIKGMRAQVGAITDSNSFYRATARLFWLDFVQNGWGDFNMTNLGVETHLEDGSPLERTSTWTWITGDQHLSNFGAWRNRHGDVVYGVNDFDEAAIYDFQIDVWRCAVSIYHHSVALGQAKAEAAVLTFAQAYVDAIASFVGNEHALLYEVTPETASGKLGEFLRDVELKRTQKKQLNKFTTVDSKTGLRRFVKNPDTRLAAVEDDLVEDIKAAFTLDRYGTTLMRIGWHAIIWNNERFQVLDVARRLGSGVGSSGVDRFYVLLKGGDELVEEERGEGIILDIKFEPPGAMMAVLTDAEKAWYKTLFKNDAARAAIAQRRLTSYTDPYSGWIVLGDRPFSVRQRSPWQTSFDLGDLRNYAAFAEYVELIAKVTAASHARGSVGNSPATFKEVVASALGTPYAKATWGISIVKIAQEYQKQVELDYACYDNLLTTLGVYNKSFDIESDDDPFGYHH